jgi:membrane associated rhomboid family serine protease
MRYSTRYRYGTSFGSSLPPGIKWLLISNVAVWAFYALFLRLGLFESSFDWLQLTPDRVVRYGAIWQLFTYLFLHSPIDPFHILFNMLALWMFGKEVERTWGTRQFLKYYFICGVGAGICVVISGLLFGQGAAHTFGASGAILGVLLAFGLLFPDATVLLIIFPIKAKYLVMIVGALTLYFSLAGGNNGVSNAAHLGGLAVGLIYLKLPAMHLDGYTLRRRYDKWKLDRAKRKFEVYMRKKDSKREPWVH